MTTIHFNTNRKYTANGQRITATLHAEDGVVTFNDHDRRVCGEFQHSFGKLTKGAVMAMYDHNRYESTRRAWQDAMMKDGCNSKYEGD